MVSLDSEGFWPAMKISEHSYGMGFSQTDEINWHRLGMERGGANFMAVNPPAKSC